MLSSAVLAATLAACAGPNRTTYYETTGFTPEREDAQGVSTFGSTRVEYVDSNGQPRSAQFRYGLGIESVEETEERRSADYNILPGAVISYQESRETSAVRIVPELRYVLHFEKGADAFYESTVGIGIEVVPNFRSSTIDIQVNGGRYPRLGVPGFGIDANFFLTWTHTLDLYLFEPAPLTGFMQYRVNGEFDVDFIWGLGLRWGEPER